MKPIILLIISSLSSWAAAALPSFDMNSIPLEPLGIKVRIFKSAKAIPAVTIESIVRRWRQGEKTWDEKVFPVEDMWRQHERGGEWSDASGALMVVARISCLLPESNDGYATEEYLTKAFDYGAEKFSKASADDVVEWLHQFSGLTNIKSDSFSRLTGTGGEIPFALQIETGSPNQIACVFKIKNAGNFWFFASFKFKEQVSNNVGKNLLMAFLRGCGKLSSYSASQQLDSRYSSISRNKGIPDDPRRVSAKKAIAGVKGWWWSENKDYIFLSDLPQSRGANFIRDTQRTMSLLRKAYKRYVPATKEIGACIVRLFADENGYKKYLSASGIQGMSSSIGLWSPSREELLVQYREDRASTLETMRHEAFHQYLYYATGRSDHMLWFNEGHATLFENIHLNSGTGQIKVLCSGNRAQWVEKMTEAVAYNLAAIKDMSHEEFYSGTREMVNLNYVSAWALCFFLSKGCHAVKGFEAYRNVIPTYLDGMAKGLSTEEANAIAWNTVVDRNLSNDFLSFWKKRKIAENYEPQ